MPKKNLSVRFAMQEKGIPQWKVARECGYSEGGFSRLLRDELSEEKRKEVLQAIERLSAGSAAAQ